MIFLIQYDRQSGSTVSKQVFLDSQRVEAADARLMLELDLQRRGIDREVVLLEARDEDALRRTHARYFDDLDRMISRLESSTGAFITNERTGD